MKIILTLLLSFSLHQLQAQRAPGTKGGKNMLDSIERVKQPVKTGSSHNANRGTNTRNSKSSSAQKSNTKLDDLKNPFDTAKVKATPKQPLQMEDESSERRKQKNKNAARQGPDVNADGAGNAEPGVSKPKAKAGYDDNPKDDKRYQNNAPKKPKSERKKMKGT
ncbi:MAG: hypothetical protein WAU23_02355 [Ferruginibacter sp.]